MKHWTKLLVALTAFSSHPRDPHSERTRRRSSAAPAATHSAARAATVKTATSPLGRIIVDGGGRTLYLFEKDRRGHSACTRACATYWPPLLAQAKPTAGRGVERALLGVTRRANGTKQVT